jgi:predicted acylesterase/phospholipase RssA
MNPTRLDELPPFYSVIFAGGGNRCVWQAGFWEVAAPALSLEPKVVASVSAGACISAMALAGHTVESMAYMKAKTGANPKNFYWQNLFNGKPVFPHVGIYRQALLDLLDAEALARLKQGPDLRVLLARPPAWANPIMGVLLGFASYTLEKHILHPLHPQWALKAGFKAEVVPVSACRSSEELADLILASSCTPPIVPAMYRDGRPVLDGGLIDNVPVAALDPHEFPALVLLTRRYPPDLLRGHRDRVYLQPSRPVPAGKWDYTNPQALQDTFDLGRRDAEMFLREGPQALQK